MTTDAIIRIKNLRLRTFIGINDEEVRNKQDVVLNIEIKFDASQAINASEIDQTLNYRTITKKIIPFVEGNRFSLLEKLSHDVLNLVMDHPEVKFAEVEIDKPHALRFADSVSVAVSRRK